uniref:Uncharacterized protein n=1 Tax=Dulem virus 33 TaxID=3145751 RepID=A0AAU8B7K0_9CAUD
MRQHRAEQMVDSRNTFHLHFNGKIVESQGG